MILDKLRKRRELKEILSNPLVDSLVMPENLKVGLMVAEHRMMCLEMDCDFDYYSFAFGQSPFPVPPPLEKALAENASNGHYSAAEGILELREAMAGFNKRHFGLDVDPSRIMVGSGTKDLIFSLFTIITGDVIIPSPSWIGYFPQLEMLGRRYHTYYLSAENDFKLMPDELDDYLKKLSDEGRQHLLVINNPHNPTGIVYSREELTRITEVCRRRGVLVLADEIYAISTYNFDEFTSMGLIYPEGAFITNGLSKDRSAGGYRLGSCIVPETSSEKMAADFAKVAATVYTNVSTPIQYAAIAVYEPNDEIEEYFRITREIHRMTGHFTSDGFNRIPGVNATRPDGTFYFYADFNSLADDLKRKGVSDSNALGHSLLGHPYHIAVVTGDALMLRPDDYGARIAFVDYDGKAAFDAYKDDPPSIEADEIEFVKKVAPRIVEGIGQLEAYVDDIIS
jgi:aspartate aminotransferase